MAWRSWPAWLGCCPGRSGQLRPPSQWLLRLMFRRWWLMTLVGAARW